MEVKNKPVTLEDLKELKEWMEGVAEVYKDITDTLTWSDATWVPNAVRDASASSQRGTKDTTAERIANVKVAKVPVSKGDKYMIYSWFDGSTINTHYKTYPLAFVDSSDNVISVYGEHPDFPISPVGVSPIHFGQTSAVAPASASYAYIFDVSRHSDIGATAGDIIVKKAST